MPTSISGLSYANVKMAMFALVLSCAGVANGQETLVYSFEPDLQGFVGNGPITPSLETSGLGATHGSNSMKVVHAQFNGFAGAITSNLPAGFPNDPSDPGIDFLRFDLTLASRFAPPVTDPPTMGVPTFADLGITFFGTLPGNPVPEAQIQYLLDQKEVGSFEAGTYTLEIDLRNGGGDGLIGAGLNVDTGVTNGYDGWIGAGFVPVEFQIYSNKSVGGVPAYEWTFYIDNVRVGQDVEGVPGDYNQNGTVDAADYTIWRDTLGSTTDLRANGDNTGASAGAIDQADYAMWKLHFGETTGSGSGSGSGSGLGAGSVPEPTSMVLWLVVGAAHVLGMRKHTLMR